MPPAINYFNEFVTLDSASNSATVQPRVAQLEKRPACRNVELDLRHIKTAMGMEILHCQSPDMNEKEL